MIFNEKETRILEKMNSNSLKTYFLIKKMSKGRNQFLVKDYSFLFRYYKNDGFKSEDEVKKMIKISVQDLTRKGLISRSRTKNKGIFVKFHFHDLLIRDEKIDQNLYKNQNFLEKNQQFESTLNRPRIDVESTLNRRRIDDEEGGGMPEPLPSKEKTGFKKYQKLAFESTLNRRRIDVESTLNRRRIDDEENYQKEANLLKNGNENQLLYSTGARARSMPFKSFKSLKEKEKKKEKINKKEKPKEKENEFCQPQNFFEKFWSAYPRKEGKFKSQQIWRNLKCDATWSAIEADLAVRIFPELPFVPSAANYLLNRTWEDEFKGAKVKTADELRAEAEAAELKRVEEIMAKSASYRNNNDNHMIYKPIFVDDDSPIPF